MTIRSTLLSHIPIAFLFFLPVAAAADFDSYSGIAYSADVGQTTNTVWKDALERGIARAINPDDYICSAPTDFDRWVNQQFFQIDDLTAITLQELGVFYWAGDAKLLFDHNANDEYIGAEGEFTQRQNKTFKDNKRFWDIYSDDILLMGMHGAEIADDDLMYAYLPIAFGNPPLFVQDILLNAARSAIAGGVVDLSFFVPGFIFESPGIPGGYNNPLLSLNAFAFSSFGEEIFPGSGIIPDKIVMGDGLIDGLIAIGVGGQEGPDYILSHEFSHHVQYEIGAFEPGPPAPEKTRRTELMADGFAAYSSSHARGNTFQASRFAEVMTSAYQVGDCAFTNVNHHGTQLQRLNAAIWGKLVSDDAPNQGHINSSASMLKMFDEALPILVAPDAP